MTYECTTCGHVSVWDFDLFPVPVLGGRFFCTHEHRRCIHGDEINLRNHNRAECLRCGKLFRDLPPICSATGQLHGSFEK